MWSHRESIETSASPARVWALFRDVAGWKRWNDGIARIELHGAFADGGTFTMQPPGAEPFVSTLRAVRENEGFTDETVLDGTRVLVHHRIEALAPQRTRIVYATEIEGPQAAEFGALITADFGAVLQALKRLAETAA